ncbi:hypothetical protein [Dactylosporangium sp. NPDC049140]|uniref:hypothetical protein n=1 Tax=Dactylosporangium sp. NPDC049140 TaxID=3155647 RepID=UPI0033ECB11E
MGRGQPIDRAAWPPSGPRRAWLDCLDHLHRADGMPSQRTIAPRMNLSAATRVGMMLRGLTLPTDDRQASQLLEALGGTSDEIAKGLRLYRGALLEANQSPAGPPDWWLRSNYVEQIHEIAPPELLDRDRELAELAAFCAGEEAYVWWRADARAGKTALMSWFTLHPPPRTWVLSFFVTARLAAQADSSAYTDALLDQLAAIINERSPSVVLPSARDGLRRRWLSEAVAKASRSGNRLVLVVDGLDEDCGVDPLSGLASVASLLPRRPDPRLRVIVSSRPDPQLPGDVPEDHPLRSAPIRALADSPHARRKSELARQELDRILAPDASGRNVLAREVIGLTAACGGGLTRADLEHLTGRARGDLDALFAGVVGRTIAGRPDPESSRHDRVFLFTHETLRASALEHLGDEQLGRYRDRVHEWCDHYRGQGWPGATPAYLLRGYPRMLRDGADVDRLVRLAIDPVRHDRMLDVTGGDALAVAEITAAEALVCTRPDPDLLTAARLALHREDLAARSTHLPEDLPSVWVHLGNPVRAEAVARSIGDPARQCRAVSLVAEQLAARGEHQRARILVEHGIGSLDQVADAGTKVALIQHLVHVLELLDEHRAAVALAQNSSTAAHAITEAQARARALAIAAATMADVGDDRLARAFADRSQRTLFLAAGPHPGGRPGADEDTAGALVRANAAIGAWAEARALATELLGGAGPAVLASAAYYAASPAVAGEIAGEVRRRLPGIDDPQRRARATIALARLAGSIDDGRPAATLLAAAEPAIAAITDAPVKSGAIADLVEVAAELGEQRLALSLAHEAWSVVRSIEDRRQRAHALARLARATAVAGEHAWATDLAQQAEELIRTAGERDRIGATFLSLSRATVAARDLPHSVALIRGCALPPHRDALAPPVRRWPWDTRPDDLTTAIADVFRLAVDLGELDEAALLPELVGDSTVRSRLFSELTAALGRAGRGDRAVAMAREAADALDGGLGRKGRWASATERELLEMLGQAAAVAGDPQEAAAVVRRLPGYSADERLRSIIVLAAEHGSTDGWPRLLDDIRDPVYRDSAALALATAVAAKGDYAGAVALFTGVGLSRTRDVALADTAVAVAARDSYDNARPIIDLITGAQGRTAAVGRAAAAAGRLDEAAAIALQLRDSTEATMLWRDLFGLFARHGRHGRARAVAMSLPDPAYRMRMLTLAAKTAAGHAAELAADDGEAALALLASAVEIADGMPDLDLRSAVLAEFAPEHQRTATLLLEAGREDHAVRAVGLMRNPTARVAAIGMLAGQAAAAGRFTVAGTLADTISGDGAFARLLHDLGERAARRRAYDAARLFIARLADDGDRAAALLAAARAAAAAADLDQAKDLARNCEYVAQRLAGTARRAELTDGVGRVLHDVALAWFALGHDDRAEAVAVAITGAAWPGRTLGDLVGAAVTAGDLGRASRYAELIADPDARDRAAADVRRAGDDSRPRFTAAPAGGSHFDLEQQRRFDGAVAAGNHRAAEDIARSIANVDRRADALAGLAELVPPADGRRLAAECLALGRWTVALPVIGRLSPHVVEVIAEEWLRLRDASSTASPAGWSAWSTRPGR